MPTTNTKNYEYLDVVSLMIKNLNQDKPLLQGAMLFHGSRFSDGQPSSDTPDALHTHLLPQVAASNTHAWGKTQAFIDTYPLDREKTRFFAQPSFEEHLKGDAAARSYSVADAERALRPLVENIAYLPPSEQRNNRLEELERFIKSSFYEASVALTTEAGQTTRPQEKFYYSGSPDVATAKDVFDRIDKVTAFNETKAKEAYAQGKSSAAARAIDTLALRAPEVAKAFEVLRGAVQLDHAATVLKDHGNKPLSEFMHAAREQARAPTQAQAMLLRLANGLAANLDSSDRNLREVGLNLSKALQGLEPGKSTAADVRSALQGMARRPEAQGHVSAPLGGAHITQSRIPEARAPSR